MDARAENWDRAVARWGDRAAKILCMALENALGLRGTGAWEDRWAAVNAHLAHAAEDSDAA